ncbi:hypothetical protein HGRIS_000567 [Hohenbuehelia grisea]|uniref:Uncharacterized protein n=1 Tax=Hohenbuehelia grisea TaxID=104357 RepID=A0ABR3JSS4_9AGAR
MFKSAHASSISVQIAPRHFLPDDDELGMSAAKPKRPEVAALEATISVDALKSSLCTTTNTEKCIAFNLLAEGHSHLVINNGVNRLYNSSNIVLGVSRANERWNGSSSTGRLQLRGLSRECFKTDGV